MQTSTSSSSSSTAVAVAANGTESSAAATPSTSDEFEAIFNQMTALVSTIDEELEHSAASTKQRSSAGGGGESTSNLSNQNSSTNSTTANSLKMKSLGSSGGPEFYHHLNHHHQFSHYHSQSLDDPHHPTIITSSSSTTTSTTNGHRTDSPDADSAFSDSISLVSSTEQSSSSSSSSSTTSSTSGKCSSASSNGVQPQTSFHPHHHLHLHQNNSPSTSSSSLPIPPPPPPLISSSNVINSFVPGPNSPLSLTTINSNSSSSTMLSEKLMNSCNIGTSPSLSSTTSSGTISATSTTSTSSISTSSNLDHQLMALNQQQELFFEQLGRCTTAEAANQKQSSLLKSPSKSEKHSGKGFDGKKGGKNEDNEDDDAQFCQRNSNSTSFYDIFSALLLSHRDSINFNVNDDEDSEDSESEDVNVNSPKSPPAKDSQEEKEALQMSSNSSDFDQTSTVVKFSSISVDNESCSSTVVNVKSSAPPHCDIAKFRKSDKKTEKELTVEENIRAAMAKIREATFRKLYLKVFAQDNSAKSLLADERMNIGAICGQLAAKNHISLDSSLCIIEHMPHLYLERFFEDHESLVENVLHWGRDSANKLYFMQRADKYDLFSRPERYLISSTENTSSTKNSSSSSSNDSTLKSSSGPVSELLRRDLIQQFFNSQNSNSGGANKVPEVEGELYLRAEGKKTWKKYFFTLRSSGLYYCPTGKLDKNGGQKPSPKSTKELLCLATFDLNSVYLGFGWKKKFKAPTDFGFALKHPQVQAKAPKHIKYLCAESEDQLRLWLTGVRIAKYGRQLWSNWEAFKQESNTGKSSEEEKLPKPSANFDSSEYYHQQSTNQSVTMRSNRNGLNRDESARSSSTSSASSGCLSEGVASTGSGTTSVSNPGVHHHHLNHHLNLHHHHHQNGGSVSPMDGGSLHYLGSPTHNNGNFNHFASSNQPQSAMSLSALPHLPQNSSSGFDTDSFPLGTIKRKPSVQSMPKIPLTKNTRNLALQSEDVLLEHEGEAEGTVYDPHMIIGHSVDHDQQIYSGTGVSEVVSPFQRGTFLSGTLRRSTTEERMRANKNNNNNFNQMMINSSVLNSSSPLHLPNPASIVQTHHLPHVNGNSSYLAPPPAPVNVNSKSDSEDELPLPPPPPTLLKESESTLSLASATAAASSNSVSFPPPPPMEVLQPNSPILQPNIQQQNLQQTPVVSTISTAAAYGSMTPQPQPKNGARLNRRLSDLSSNSTFFLNNNGSNSFNNRNGAQQPQEFNFNQQQQFPQSPQSPSYLMAANSRASIATSGESTSSGLYGPSAGFVTLKPYHNRGASISGSSLNGGGGLMNARHHRQLTLDLNAALNKYGTAPRLRNTDQQQLLATMARDYEIQNQNLSLNQNGGSTFNGGVSSPSSPSLPPPNSSIYQSNNNNSPTLYHHQNHSIPQTNGAFSNQYNGNNETMLPPPQQHPQMLYQQQQSYLLNGQSLPSPPPPPPPALQNFQTNSAINSRPSTNENVIYMSISPHLLQKHQAMAVVNDVYQAHQQPIYGPTPITPLSPSLPPPPPPEQIFLKSMERVMAKKWHVAQMLRSTESEYYGSTPGQVLGFRDPAYLPPREGQQIQQQQQPYQQQQMAYQQTAPPPPPQMPYYPYQQQQQGPPGPIYQQQQQQPQQSHPAYQPEMPINQQQQQQIYGTQQGAQQIYAGGSSLGKRVPPPPPKRSENTHLTLGQQQQQQQSSRR